MKQRALYFSALFAVLNHYTANGNGEPQVQSVLQYFNFKLIFGKYVLRWFLVADTRSVGTTIAVGQNMQICHSLGYLNKIDSST